MTDTVKKKPARVTLTASAEVRGRLQALLAGGAFGSEAADQASAGRLILHRMLDRMEAGLPIASEPIARVAQKEGAKWTLRFDATLWKRLDGQRHDHPIGRVARSSTSFIEDILRYGIPMEEERFAAGSSSTLESVKLEPPVVPPLDVPPEPPVRPVVYLLPKPPALPLVDLRPSAAPMGGAVPPNPFEGLVFQPSAMVFEPVVKKAGEGMAGPITLGDLSAEEGLAQFLQAEVEILASSLGKPLPKGETELVEPLRSLVSGVKTILALPAPSVRSKPMRRRR